MTDAEEIRSEALCHAIALRGPMIEGEVQRDVCRAVLAAAVVFQAFIQEGHAEAVRITENRPDPADVIQLVRTEA